MAKKKLKKSEKRLLIALGIIAVISAGVLYNIYGPKPTPEPISQSDPDKVEATTSSTRSGGGSRGGASRGGSRGGGGSSQPNINNIEKHNQRNDCWTTIDGQVYDITGFIQDYQETDSTVSQYCGTYGFEVGFLGENPQLKDYVLRNSSKV